MIRIAIVEDETEIAETLKSYLKKFFFSLNTDIFTKHFDNAIKFLDQYRFDFDLVFMDINLPGIDGMRATKELREKDRNVTVIFVTSLAQYAIKGYEVNAFDFILKPVDYYSFSIKLKRFMEVYRNNEGHTMLIKVKNELIKIQIQDIKYIEVLNHKLMIHTVEKNYEIYDSLNNYLTLLENEPFALCNRCYLINLKYVRKVTKETVIVGDENLQMSRRKYNDFMDALNTYLANGGDINV